MNRNTILCMFLGLLSALLIGSAVKQILAPQFIYDQDETHVVVTYSHLWSTGCVDATWTTSHISAIFIQGAGTVGEGRATICDSTDGPEFSINLPSGVTLTYNREMLWQMIKTYLWLASLCLAVIWFVPMYGHLLLIGVCLLAALAFWFVQGMPVLPLAVRPFNTSSVLNQVIILALCLPILYWRVVWPAHRLVFLLGVGGMVFVWNGALYEYLLLLTVLITWVSVLWFDIPEASSPHVSGRVVVLCGGLVASLACCVAVKTSAFNDYAALNDLSPPLTAMAILFIGLLGWWAIQRAVLRTMAYKLISPIIIAGLGITALLPERLAEMAQVPILSLWLVLAALALIGMAFLLGPRIAPNHRYRLAVSGLFLLLGLFTILKWPDAHIIGWLGFSYIAFRLLHLLLEYRKKIPLPAMTPAQMGLYTTFFSAQLVGPIDLMTHFVPQMHTEQVFNWNDYGEGWQRILWGTLKKFFLADVLLATVIPGTVPLPYLTPMAAWVQIYAYAFYLYCDFSGFVDIAIGLARLVGYRLPENFDAPYTKGSLAQFWQSWHITLSGWIRTYVYLPASRMMLRTRMKRSTLSIVLFANLLTMLLIGVWHGFTLNFILWGVWHAVGLLLHKVFSDQTRRRQIKWRGTWRAQAFHVFSVLLTFHFVVLGWVFFALPDPEASIAFLKLLGGVHS